MITLLSLLFLAAPTYAQDAELERYVVLFSQKPLPAVRPKNKPLYELGMRLFHDRKLSGTGDVSCHSCHTVSSFSGDALPLGLGVGAVGTGANRREGQGVILPRHTPPLYNVGIHGIPRFFWDGRVSFTLKGWQTPEPGLNGLDPSLGHITRTLDSLLAVQTLFPIANPDEMLGRASTLSRVEAWEAVMARLLEGPERRQYQELFQRAFPGVREFNIGHVGNALAELQRHLFLANDTPWDRYLKGDKQILSRRMKRGAIIFYIKGHCHDCHNGPHLSSFITINNGVPQLGPGVDQGDDKGLYEFTGNPRDAYKFRVQPLRNVALTAPYMHTGVFNTIWEVIAHYENSQRSLMDFRWDTPTPRYKSPLVLEVDQLSERLRTTHFRPLELTQTDREDLYCFLMVGLTDMKHQRDLRPGPLDMLNDCSPVSGGAPLSNLSSSRMIDRHLNF